MSTMQDRIVAVLRQNGPMTVRQISEAILGPQGKAGGKVGNSMKGLIRFGIVEQVDTVPGTGFGSGGVAVWALTEGERWRRHLMGCTGGTSSRGCAPWRRTARCRAT